MKSVAVMLSVHEGQTDNLKDSVFTQRLFETGECLIPTPTNVCYKLTLIDEDTAEIVKNPVVLAEETPDLFGGEDKAQVAMTPDGLVNVAPGSDPPADSTGFVTETGRFTGEDQEDKPAEVSETS